MTLYGYARVSVREPEDKNLSLQVERLWRTVKYEEVYLKAYASASEARRELSAYFRFYNNLRPHQALGYRTPSQVFHGAGNAPGGGIEDMRMSPGTGAGIIGRSSGTLA